MTTMQAVIVSGDETINYPNVRGMVINTLDGKKHLTNSNGIVEPVKRGKVELLIVTPDGELKTIEYSVNDGVAYVENKTINVVADVRKQSTSVINPTI